MYIYETEILFLSPRSSTFLFHSRFFSIVALVYRLFSPLWLVYRLLFEYVSSNDKNGSWCFLRPTTTKPKLWCVCACWMIWIIINLNRVPPRIKRLRRPLNEIFGIKQVRQTSASESEINSLFYIIILVSSTFLSEVFRLLIAPSGQVDPEA